MYLKLLQLIIFELFLREALTKNILKNPKLGWLAGFLTGHFPEVEKITCYSGGQIFKNSFPLLLGQYVLSIQCRQSALKGRESAALLATHLHSYGRLYAEKVEHFIIVNLNVNLLKEVGKLKLSIQRKHVI